MRVRTFFCFVLLILGACSFNNKPTPKQTFLLTVNRPESAATSPTAAATVKVQPFTVIAPYNGKSMVYRDSDVRFQADYYNEWFAAPAAMLTDRTVTWLAQSGVFRKVVPPASGLDGTLELEGIVTELLGDYRDQGKPIAVVAVQFHCSDAASGKLVYDGLLRETSPLAERTPEALARGIDTATAHLLARLENDLKIAVGRL